jgi:uncharacterized membrane protein SpoIIM required for sporulation
LYDPRVSPTRDDRLHVKQLATLVARAGRGGPRRLNEAELADLPRLYRFASSLLARLETRGEDDELLLRLRPLLLRTHGLLHPRAPGTRAGWPRRLAGYWLGTVPATVRAEWRLVTLSLVLIYGLATLAYLLVRGDLTLAYSLLDPAMVDGEVAQLRGLEPGEAFRGNFTFGVGESAGTAGWIMANNMRVSMMFFALALFPPLYLYVLASNSLMLGTYTAVAGHWGQAGSISSILWCHGVLEIQAIALAGTGGLLLLRPLIAPGPFSRRSALRRDGRRALNVLAATFPMLFAAGLIEGFVSPHADFTMRVTVAVVTGLALLFWVLASPALEQEATYAG